MCAPTARHPLLLLLLLNLEFPSLSGLASLPPCCSLVDLPLKHTK